MRAVGVCNAPPEPLILPEPISACVLGRPKRPAVGLRRGATQTNEVLAKHGTAAESDAFCDDVDGEVGILEEMLGGQYSLIAEPAGGGLFPFPLGNGARTCARTCSRGLRPCPQ